MTEKTIEKRCDHCGESFSIIPSRVRHGRGKHCSPACQYASMRSRPSNGGVFICKGCGNKFSRPKSTSRKAKYCTRACRDIYWMGEQTPNWQNGEGVYKRGPRWHSIRRRIIARDKVCANCGALGGLHVHHKIPFRMFSDPDIANSDDNLIALCPPCHRKEDARHKWVGFDSGAVLQFSAGSILWQMAKEKGMV